MKWRPAEQRADALDYVSCFTELPVGICSENAGPYPIVVLHFVCVERTCRRSDLCPLAAPILRQFMHIWQLAFSLDVFF